MSKMLIYTANTTSTSVAVGGTIPVGSIIRRYGNILLNGNVINLREPGYYDVNVNATFSAAATGTVTISLYKDGVEIPGATTSVNIDTASTQVEAASIDCIVRVMCCGNSNIYAVVSGNAPTISNFTMKVTKI